MKRLIPIILIPILALALLPYNPEPVQAPYIPATADQGRLIAVAGDRVSLTIMSWNGTHFNATGMILHIDPPVFSMHIAVIVNGELTFPGHMEFYHDGILYELQPVTVRDLGSSYLIDGVFIIHYSPTTKVGYAMLQVVKP